MAEKDSLVQLREALSLPETPGINKKYIEIMLQGDIPVICVNRSVQKKRALPFKALYSHNSLFWQQETNWEYFISVEDLAAVKEEAVTRPGAWETWTGNEDQELTPLAESFGAEYEAIVAMTDAERVHLIEADKERLDKLIMEKSVDIKVITEAMVDTSREAALVNHAAIMDAINLTDDEAKKITQSLVDSTKSMIKSSTQLVSKDLFSNAMMNALMEKSNGTIIHHITSVYLNGIAFLSYYNKLVSTSSAIIKLRVSFASKYHEFYCALLPHLAPDDVTLERVFYKGMRAIPPHYFFDWAVGFLLHDIGKAAAVEYHEGEAAYNREIVLEHVKQGYASIMNKTSYPQSVSLIAGYHHEYYGDSAGYGYFRAKLEQHRKANPKSKQDYCISYEIEPMMNYETLAYFPAKVLEIVDIFDSVTDPNRKYRKPMSTEEALVMMQDEFIEQHRRIDPILFDIFSKFQREQKK
ncbi:MAG: metal-dependent phosphohydrolase [Treponema sp.]|jgi:response regulator RpfG family c-di-GMP phosphodiesterase|nr:metal-dependent phosphohydrolase [Treponema sp.]